MKFLLCCTLVPTRYEVIIKEISNAANRFLTNFSSNLAKYDEVQILSYIGVKVDDQIKEELKKQQRKNMQLFFKSDGFFKSILNMLIAIWKEVQACDYAITYNVVYAWMLTPVFTKICRKKSVLILADYTPMEVYTNKKQRIYAKIQEYFIGQFDYVIGLSEKTRRYLKGKQKFICMEGGISEEVYQMFDEYSPARKEKLTLMYSGILEKVTGIDLLIEAYKKIQRKDIQLLITGDGTLASWVKRNAEENEDIHYLGCIPYEDYIERLREADVLINPRNMNFPENMNNFPSKIMEFLATGKPIISTKYPGWERYQEYIEFCESDSASIRATIEEYVIKAKNWTRADYEKNRIFAKRFLWNSQIRSIKEFLEKAE